MRTSGERSVKKLDHGTVWHFTRIEQLGVLAFDYPMSLTGRLTPLQVLKKNGVGLTSLQKARLDPQGF